MTVLVTGASGTVGREVVRALLDRGVGVRALTRTPDTAELPAEVDIVQGDLTDLTSVEAALDGVDAVHLITFSGARGSGGGEPLDNAEALVALIERGGVRRVSVLHGGYEGPVETAVRASTLDWTILMPVEFMANLLDWAESISTTGAVEEGYVDRLSALVHEADIGDVAAVVLTEDGHAGREYPITGREVLTVRGKLDAIADALGSDVDLVELSEAETVQRWRDDGRSEEEIGFFTWIYGNTPEIGRTVADTVPRLTGHPARTLRQWAGEQVGAFRP